jgi:hypothetical protein
MRIVLCAALDPQPRPLQVTAMRPSRLVIALVLVLVGAVWIGQGSGLIAGSAMTGSPFWGVMGVVLVAAAAVVLFLARRRPVGK